MKYIDYKIKSKVCIIKFNRPKVFNSINKIMAFELQEILDRCKENDNVRSLLLTGVGKAFCAGQDLQEITDQKGPPLTTIRSLSEFEILKNQ